MAKEILGKKLGMTNIFKDGVMIPVTVVEAGPCYVTQIKTKDVDGYDGVQVGYLPNKVKNTTKPMLGHLEKSNTPAVKILREINVEGEVAIGDKLTTELFQVGDYVDVQGKSKGKGFAGTIKRHGFHRGPMGHGSHYHRGGGSLGTMGPAHVFKGHKMAGRMGGNKVTIQNLQIVDILADENIILVKGAIPGSKKGVVSIKSAIKK